MERGEQSRTLLTVECCILLRDVYESFNCDGDEAEDLASFPPPPTRGLNLLVSWAFAYRPTRDRRRAWTTSLTGRRARLARRKQSSYPASRAFPASVTARFPCFPRPSQLTIGALGSRLRPQAAPWNAMDEEDRFSASSAESERENEQDEAMEDVDEANNDNEAEEDNMDEDDDGDDDGEVDNEVDGDDAADDGQNADGETRMKSSKSVSPGPPTPPPRPMVRPEVLTAKLYDIVPTMAAPQSTSVNAMAIAPDLRYWITGGSDRYIRKYDGAGTINGKLALTVAQKHPFVDSVTKAGILMSYWENEEPSSSSRGDQEHRASVRHDEGKKICCLQRHTNAVSVLTLAPDETSVLSGGWDKNLFDWDLNTGQTKRNFDGSGGQISSIELRPASGVLIPAEADEPMPSTTMTSHDGLSLLNGGSHDEVDGGSATGFEADASADARDPEASPAHESLFGGSDAGSLFGETAGEQPFGHDDDGFDTSMGTLIHVHFCKVHNPSARMREPALGRRIAFALWSGFAMKTSSGRQMYKYPVEMKQGSV
ncbi:hypothetical protein RJ55_06747 [Drechmeria coniospora]|nr:hypothetical protein RJ55_06747 [Drechmeria coniospora]